MPTTPSRRAAHAGAPLLALLLALGVTTSGCVAVQDEDDDLSALPPIELHPTPAPTAPAPTVADIVILDLKEEPGSDPSLVRLTGTIVNRSNQDALRVQVRIEARDAAGRALTRVTAQAFADVIPPGTASSFTASLPRSTAIHDYHAEIVAR